MFLMKHVHRWKISWEMIMIFPKFRGEISLLIYKHGESDF